MPVTEDQVFAAIVERVESGGRLLGVQRLTGGVSADVHALDVRLPRSGHRRIVVRRHGVAAWKPQHVDVATLEHGVLRSLHGAGLPVPEPLLLDTSAGSADAAGSLSGHGVPGDSRAASR